MRQAWTCGARSICAIGCPARQQRCILLWLVDCQSIADHLNNPAFGKFIDKRLSIELAALRQLLWQWAGGDGTIVDELGPECHDLIRWIDTSSATRSRKGCMHRRLDCMMKRARMERTPIDAGVLARMKKQKALVADVLNTPTAGISEPYGWV